MARNPYTTPLGPPPPFEDAKNRRQKVRACGMNPNYWYPAGFDADLGRGEVQEVVFWKRSIAVYRAENGKIHALENRCAHRQLRLSKGEVKGCNLVCGYHGWFYNGDGKVEKMSHETFGLKPKIKIPSFPVQVRYGLIWIFPGDPELAATTKIPDIPEIEGPKAWPFTPIDMTIHAHHSMVMDNVSDYTHGYLHRKHEPFSEATLDGFKAEGDAVNLTYSATIAAGKVMDMLVDRDAVGSGKMKLGYQYPYHWSNTDGQIMHWLFLLPVDERTTRMFFVLYYRSFRIPLTSKVMPRFMMKKLIDVGNKLVAIPVFNEDKVALEEEQRAWEANWDAPVAELNPIVRAFQDLTIRKWEQYLESKNLTSIRQATRVEQAETHNWNGDPTTPTKPE